MLAVYATATKFSSNLFIFFSFLFPLTLVLSRSLFSVRFDRMSQATCTYLVELIAFQVSVKLNSEISGYFRVVCFLLASRSCGLPMLDKTPQRVVPA